ncbi:MAG: hypothetical protein QGH51_09770 [Planctomycetota bacterium]|jgi:hypothetical protein|nr:hypothetical protein [Planctomycetota bacterium]
MTPPPKSSATARAFLKKNAPLLEPGLCLEERPLELSEGVTIDLWGSDALGRPVLLFVSASIKPPLFDQILDAVSRFQETPGRWAGRFQAATDARVIVVTEKFSDDLRRRMEVFARAVPLRVLQLQLPTTTKGRPEVTPIIPAGKPDILALAQDISENTRAAASRFLSALFHIRPSFQVQGAKWPILLTGVHGPFGILFQNDGKLSLCCSNENGATESIGLVDDLSVDMALDSLMRQQWTGDSEAA